MENKELLLEYLKDIYYNLDNFDRNLLPTNSLEELLGLIKQNIECLERKEEINNGK